MSGSSIVQIATNGISFAVGTASVVLILLQYILLGIMLMNLFVFIMIYLDKQKQKSEKETSQQQHLPVE